MTMNGDDDNINLALALGSSSYCVPTKSNKSSGAGVNANLEVNVAFAASDPVSELVWSPHKGLSLKTAGSSLADRKPFLLWNVGPSNQVLAPSLNVGFMRLGEDLVIDDPMLSHSILDAGTKPDKSIGELNNAASTPMLPRIVESGDEKELIESPGANPLIYCDLSNINDLNAIDADPNVAKSSNDATARPIMELNDTGTLASGGMNQNEGGMMLDPIVSMELSAKSKQCDLMAKENRCVGETVFPVGSSLPNEESQTNDNICLHQKKGKGKAFPDGGLYRETFNHDNESNESVESVESCNSVGLISRNNKRKNYDQSLIIDSKRMKNSFQGSHGSTSNINKPHSSFMNWISNMVKGSSDYYKEESSALDLTLACTNAKQVKDDQEVFECNKTHDSPGSSKGFQTMFQSLYHGMNEVSAVKPQEENYFIQQEKEIVVTDKASADNSSEPHCGENENLFEDSVVNQHKEPGVLPEDLASTPNACEPRLGENEATGVPALNNTAENPGSNRPMALGLLPGKSNYLTSLWHTRLSTKIHQLENCEQIGKRTMECSLKCPKVIVGSINNDACESTCNSHKDLDNAAVAVQKGATDPTASVDCRSAYKLTHEIPSPKIGNPEAIASLFSRRLGALKHIKPSKSDSQFSWTCLFCGIHGHDLRNCSKVTKAEIENLVVRISLYGRIEDSQRLCLRCFKSDHWAISCSSASSLVHEQSGQNVFTSDHHAVISPQPCFGEEPCLDSDPCDQNCNAMESSGRAFKSNQLQNKNLILLNVFNAWNVPVPLDIFEAIKKLRLSRSDILRCMNCHATRKQLNGFFLRLRLGKLESRRSDTAYYVARITECTEGRSKKSILVDVGGFKSSVGSQYISNQDFLEDEIKSWWYRILKTGSKFPSLDELNSKFIDRTSLGV